VTGVGALVEFDFTALAPGTSDLTILNNADLILQDSTGGIISSTETGGSVTVQGTSAVPEPSVLMLLGVGLLALMSLTLKKTIRSGWIAKRRSQRSLNSLFSLVHVYCWEGI
jgi:hypothetical protein